MIDFSLSLPLLGAFVIAVAVPAILAARARAPSLRGQNARQFLVTSILAFFLWYGFLLFADVGAVTLEDLALGHMLLVGALLFYLEIWALLLTGYTLAILIALLHHGGPMPAAEIARAYRLGDGLEWIARSRLTRIAGAGLLDRREGSVALTVPRGVLVAQLYRVCIRFLGLARTG